MKFIEVTTQTDNIKVMINVESIISVEKLVDGKARIITANKSYEVTYGYNKVKTELS